MLPEPFIGAAVVSFATGEAFDIEVDVRFRMEGRFITGSGSAIHKDPFTLMKNISEATLSQDGRSVKIIFTSAGPFGDLQLKTSGPVSG